jgi:Sulfotransferase family
MKKVFILGCPRSGTTMLQQALNRHSQIIIPPETKFFFSIVGCSKQCQMQQVRRINEDLSIDVALPAKRIVTVNEARILYEEMAVKYASRLNRLNSVYFGEKTPEQTGRLFRIRRVFPDAKLVFIYRDGRDVALSLTKVPWMRANLYVGFMIWLYYYAILMRAKENNQLDLCLVKYEDLVSKPKEELRRILAFLELSYEPTVAEGHGNREGIPLREYAWKSRALDRITDERIGNWRRELSPTQISRLESFGRRALTALGYQITRNKCEPLPLRFFADLCVNGFKVFYGLPWQAVAAELVGVTL